jgi:amidase
LREQEDERMQRITRDHFTFNFSSKHPAVETVNPGDEILFETRDGSDGQIRTGQENLDKFDLSRGNPGTGPVAVTGAEPGDTLVIEILNIKLAPQGYLAVRGGWGAVKEMNHCIKMIRVENGEIHFSNSLRVPTRPMIGMIGTALADSEISTLHPGRHGGNMDNIEVSVGAKLYLPVFVPGALLSLGDVHANQGDGEIMSSALEIESEVTVKVDLLKGRCWERPWIETREAWVTCADAPTLQAAIRLATEDMVNLLREKMPVSREEAYMLVSLNGGLRICQACEGPINPTVRAVVPKLRETCG